MMGVCFKLFQYKKCLNCCRLLLTLCCNAFLCHYATWIYLEYLFILRGGHSARSEALGQLNLLKLLPGGLRVSQKGGVQLFNHGSTMFNL